MFEIDNLIKRVTEAVQLGSKKALDELTKEFNTPVQILVPNSNKWVTSNCSDIIFINTTPVTVTTNGNIYVDNYQLQPGGYVGYMGNNAEINRQQYVITFESASVSLIVLKKLYVNR